MKRILSAIFTLSFLFASCNSLEEAGDDTALSGETNYGNEDVQAEEVVPVTNIIINPSEATLMIGAKVQFNISVEPDNATDMSVTWTIGDETIATIEDGLLTAVGVGETEVAVTSNDGGATSICAVTVISDKINAVDMGLSVLWADRNVGADSPEATGEHYMWGEIEPYNGDPWDLSDSFMDYYKKKYERDKYNGTNLYLDKEDDVAYIKYGGKWRLPSKSEMDELLATRDNPDYQWSFVEESSAYFAGSRKILYRGWWINYLKNGNRIFLPTTESFPNYWTATCYAYFTGKAYSMFCFFTDCPSMWGIGSTYRYAESSIRPVYGDPIRVEGISMEETKVTMKMYVGDESVPLNVSLSPKNAFEQGIIWSSSNPTVVSVHNGYVRRESPGTAIITATSADGGFTATCEVTVEDTIF
ncbi:MAG: Ig-like domain-containing protein [Bacteroidales bacterium]|nr:Ig-like domain-containing protein [Bacteroidales bacterium]